MAYISNGRVVEKPQGIVATLRSFIAAFLALVTFFLQSLLNPEALSTAKKSADDKRGPGNGRGGQGGGGPRIRGVDNITGGSHSAQCNTGG